MIDGIDEGSVNGSGKSLAVRPQQQMLARRTSAGLNRHVFEPDSWDSAIVIAETLCKSGLLPQDVRTPQTAVAIIMFGREFGFTVWQSFRFVQVIKGKPGLNAQGMAAVILASGKAKYFRCSEVTENRATWETVRADGDGKIQRFTYTIDDARKAELTSSQMYRKYPRQMLRWRACTELARQEYSDVVGGLYTPDDFGEVIDADFSESPEHIEAAPPADAVEAPPPADAVEPAPVETQPVSKTEAVKAALKKQADPQTEAIKGELAALRTELVGLLGEVQAGWIWGHEVQTTRTLRERLAKAHEVVSREMAAADSQAAEPGSNG